MAQGSILNEKEVNSTEEKQRRGEKEREKKKSEPEEKGCNVFSGGLAEISLCESNLQ